MDGSVRELTTAVAAGDTEALTVLFRSRFDEMYAAARRATGRDESFCMDVVQDAMVRVIRSLRPMDTERHLKRWLRVVVQSSAYDLLRRESRQRRREQAAAGGAARGTKENALADQLTWLRRELRAVDDPNIRLLLMRYRLGWTLQRIGDAAGLAPGAVDGRLRRLIAKLRRRAKESCDG